MYHVQDKVVRMMRDLANTRNIHITIVCHPRKTMVSPKSGLQVLNEYDIDAVFFRRDQTFARFSGRGLQKFIGHFGLILNLRDVECARPFCFGKN